MPHQLERVNNWVFYDAAKDRYIKTSAQGAPERDAPDITSLTDDHLAYQQLARYFRVPNTRLLNHRADPILVLAKAPGEPLSHLMHTDSALVGKAFSQYSADLIRSWQQTGQSMDEAQLSRDVRQRAIRRAERIARSTEFQRTSHKPVKVNGIKYPAPIETLGAAHDRLLAHVEPTMVYGHGDEHYGNILADESGYTLIDPRSAGFMSPTSAVNSLVGAFLRGCASYDSTVEEDTHFHISYNHSATSEQAKLALAPSLHQLVEELNRIQRGAGLLREHLYVNLARAIYGTIYPMDRTEIIRNRDAAFAIATQMYYEGVGL